MTRIKPLRVMIPPVVPDLTPWTIAGTYFESCNCEAICPCRMIGDRPGGGRSTYGICFGVLSWRVEEGSAGAVDLDGLSVVLVCQYDDDEEGSPWTFALHVDERANEQQREALASIFLGRLGGEKTLRLPWVRKASHLVDVRSSRIEIEHGPEGHGLRVGTAIGLRASRPVETEDRVACGIPGYEITGVELYADELIVIDEPFEWELNGNCAFTSRFAYSS
jgi:hypothetical protein